ncbi:hypothetical protein [Sorangium sp. So ce145]|uniref:hypothetical protein n=1 Tax=Sorangium sp. So ce145 TaxID=3133285 RepID=UPI003F620CE8
MEEKSFWQRNQSDKAQNQIAREAKKFGLDKKALNIAYNACKDLDAFDPALTDYLEPPEEDLAYAIEKKVLLRLPLNEHDQTISMLRDKVRQVDRVNVVNSFVASLSAGRPDWRSPLSSYAYHLHHPAHDAQEKSLGHTGNYECQICGFLRNPNNGHAGVIEYIIIRFRGGGIHHPSPGYALADLIWSQEGEKVKPSEADWKILSKIFSVIRALPETAQLKELNESLSGLVKGNKSDRQGILETLGYCGILTARSRPTVCNTWFRPHEDLPSHLYKKEWRYPTCWWTGEEGLGEEAIAFWFPELSLM